MKRYEYDEEASERLHVDAVYEIDDASAAQAQWVDSMRRLNAIEESLARRIMALHRDCGSGTGVCDSVDDEPVPWADRTDWGCETTAIIAAHFGVEYAAA